ncbi:MAG: prolipoprotein diacylglyceryl transferase [Deltaproteobacteria bacterium]|nr:prolipoprotein diacylglyceryl transferase [Nannocystaceae bacterium]
MPGTAWEVSAYGFFMGLALVAGWLLALSLAARDKLPTDRLGTSYVVAVAFGLVVARAGWLFGHPEAWQGFGSLLALQQGGLSAGAGIAAAAVFTALHTSRMGIPTLVWLDAAAPALALGVALEHVGALLAGSGFGRYAPDVAWAIRFPEGSPAFVEHRRELAQLLGSAASSSLPVHPTQIIGAILALVALALALWLRRRRRWSGQVFFATAALLLAAHSLIETPLRADRDTPVLGPFAPGQLFALALLAIFAGIARARAARARTNASGMRPWEGGPWSPP